EGNLYSKHFIINEEQKDSIESGESYSLNYYEHFNHYVRIQLDEQSPLQSSKDRELRGQQFGEIRTVNEAKQLLGDDENKDYPIYRKQDSVDGVATLCTAHFDLLAAKLYVYKNNLKSSLPTIEFDLNSL
ncbi:unnamed protein product, partial [Didymodactylos carnosus]